jgi:hypothetical protein
MSHIVPGTFRARAVAADLGFAGTGTEQIAISFEFLDGENAGMHITYYGFFTDRARERTFESLRNCGWKGDDLSDLSGVGDNDVEIVIEMEDDRPRVRWVNRLGGGLALGTRMTDEQKRRFAAEMRGYAVAFRKGTAAPAAAPPPPPPPAPTQTRPAQRQSSAAPRTTNGAASRSRANEPTSLDDLNY